MNIMDTKRRKFLKVLLIGTASFIVGKISGPLLSGFFGDSFSKSESTLFRVVENKKRLSVYDDSGEEIFQIDKGA